MESCERAPLGILACSHSFCFGCINTWAQHNHCCPLCKLEFEYITKKSEINRVSARTRFSRKRAMSCKEDKIPLPERIQQDHPELDFQFLIPHILRLIGRHTSSSPSVLHDLMIISTLGAGRMFDGSSQAPDHNGSSDILHIEGQIDPSGNFHEFRATFQDSRHNADLPNEVNDTVIAASSTAPSASLSSSSSPSDLSSTISSSSASSSSNASISPELQNVGRNEDEFLQGMGDSLFRCPPPSQRSRSRGRKRRREE